MTCQEPIKTAKKCQKSAFCTEHGAGEIATQLQFPFSILLAAKRKKYWQIKMTNSL
jgi:hypothetical protein